MSKEMNEAIKLIEKGWVRNATAIDKDENDVAPSSDEAVAWCPLGALERVCGKNKKLFNKLITQVAVAIVCEGKDLDADEIVSSYNDYTAKSKKQVVEILKKASKIKI